MTPTGNLAIGIHRFFGCDAMVKSPNKILSPCALQKPNNMAIFFFFYCVFTLNGDLFHMRHDNLGIMSYFFITQFLVWTSMLDACRTLYENLKKKHFFFNHSSALANVKRVIARSVCCLRLRCSLLFICHQFACRLMKLLHSIGSQIGKCVTIHMCMSNNICRLIEN